MELVESMFKYAFVFDLVIAAILFIIVTSWLRLKRRTFLRLMMTTSPQYDFIKGQLMTFLTENMQSLVVGILASINGEGDKPEADLDQFFRKLYGRFDLVRRSRFGRLKFERALHFAIKAKLVSHPLDLMGTRWVLRKRCFFLQNSPKRNAAVVGAAASRMCLEREENGCSVLRKPQRCEQCIVQ